MAEEPAFENIVDELQKLVAQLESGNLALDESLRLYERGVALARQANGLLEGTEKRIEVLQKSLGESNV